ncbi:lysine--tRNA ligase [Candidatus Daviesbacteria bacterium]|nr:lysine--tRNA ligase [Candidatus Daviesbacteria bacterium]
MALENLQKERLKKLKNIKNLGINAYPSLVNRKQTTAQAVKMLGKNVAVAGRIRSLRPHGKITFADLEDESGKIQLFFSLNELPGDKYDILANLDIGDFLSAEGEVFKTQAGEVTVKVKSYSLLTKSLRPLPSKFYGLADIEERYRQRYVDLIINPDVRKTLDIRHKAIRFLRNFMEEKGFVEVETPTLQPIYGGATAKPFVTSHHALDSKFYLRISDELYLKRLIVGGFEKVFEICKDFRNEGIDRQHNPEFTMMEFYWAYAEYGDLMKLTEEMVSKLVKEIHGNFKFKFEEKKLDFSAPFKRVKFADLVKEHSGIDLNEVDSEEKLLQVIKEKEIKLELHNVVGYGPLVDELYKTVAGPNITQPTFITDYPYEMLPLAKAKEEDPTRPSSGGKKAASFQLLCMGFELVKAYNELNDPAEQKKKWIDEINLGKKGLEEHQVLDEDYIRALEYGMPPTAGWGMGVDRLVSLLTNQHSIKDVILFPTLKPEKKLKIPSLKRADESRVKQDFSKKMVVVLNKSVKSWEAMNTVGHISAFLGNKMRESFDTGDYFKTKDGKKHPRNSQYPVVTLVASKKDLKKLINELRDTDLIYIGYVPEMVEFTDDQKLEKAISSMEDEKDEKIEYLGVGIFGENEKMKELTKQFSLWK